MFTVWKYELQLSWCVNIKCKYQMHNIYVYLIPLGAIRLFKSIILPKALMSSNVTTQPISEPYSNNKESTIKQSTAKQ